MPKTGLKAVSLCFLSVTLCFFVMKNEVIGYIFVTYVSNSLDN